MSHGDASRGDPVLAVDPSRSYPNASAVSTYAAASPPEGAAGEPRPVKWLLDRGDGIRSVYVEEMEQRDGSFKFAVRQMGSVLAKDGEWEYEPQPSSRTDDYLARTRYASLTEAIAAFRARRDQP